MREKYLVLQTSDLQSAGQEGSSTSSRAPASTCASTATWEEKKKEDKELKEPRARASTRPCSPVLRGESWRASTARAAHELLDIARLAQRFSFRP
jgi:hypothetical protein